ncbi:hypothetical protein [Streptomyces boncukensis]|uniref:Uncharacterized protein n=1 Tax=Streptomyces boncukensis TaxID=2711219 RepID=A0A6G4X0G0_9ACTN|nr:hypothetical protein [Streptomyces boncukensis]NGO70975.1 hypothetical protein [Streptomyces boncukensis]
MPELHTRLPADVITLGSPGPPARTRRRLGSGQGRPAQPRGPERLTAARGADLPVIASAAVLCASALAQHGRVTILTSDVEDIALLSTDHARVAPEKV